MTSISKILVIGDTHIPTRASRIPVLIETHITSKQYNMVLCTGDLVEPSVLNFLKNIAPTKVVVGNMDYLDLPEYEVVNINNIRIGLIHGHQVRPRGDIRKLSRIAYDMNVKILICGHTHVPLVKKVMVDDKEILILNPGSATGVWSGGGGSLIPSFMELEIISSGNVSITLYELKGNILTKSSYSVII